ncbi:sugar fermentation stimulation protein [Aureococcus anophagefferens]|nr:sugar fermentation stimulation protein [Aureococcus anophagefferens]
MAAVLEAGVLAGFRGATAVVAEKTIPARTKTKSRCDFFCADDGFDHWIEVKNCHSSYPDEPLLRSYGYFPDSVSERAARHCRELAKLGAKPNTRCTVVIVAAADATKGIRPSDYHDPGFAAAARARETRASPSGASARRTRRRAARRSNEIAVDLAAAAGGARRHAPGWKRASAITGWD